MRRAGFIESSRQVGDLGLRAPCIRSGAQARIYADLPRKNSLTLQPGVIDSASRIASSDYRETTAIGLRNLVAHRVGSGRGQHAVTSKYRLHSRR